MPKIIKVLVWSIIALAVLAITVFGSIYLANQTRKKKTTAQSCVNVHASNHKVRIQNGAVIPVHTDARRCDKLIITNLDGTNRLMAFGVHDSHRPYDGIEERLLGAGQSMQVVLIDTGNFRFHDHLHDEIQGTFTVR